MNHAVAFLSKIRSLKPATLTRAILILIGLILLVSLLGMKKPWTIDINPEKAKVSQYVDVFVWKGLAVDLVLIAGLILTAGWWMRAQRSDGTTAPKRRAPRWFWPLVAVAMLLNAAICWPRLTHSFWHDETYPIKNAILGNYKEQSDGSLKLKQVSWADTFFFYKKPNHTLYSGIARVCNDLWRSIAKPKGLQFNETVIRMPAYLAGIGSVAAIALLLEEMEFLSAGVIAAFFYAIHPWHIRYASEARAYGFVLLLVPLVAYAFLRALRTGDWKSWVLFGLMEFLLIYFYFTCVYILVVVNLCMIPALWWRWGKTPELVTQSMRWIVVNIFAGMLFLPLVWPCVPQFLAYVKTTGGQGEMSFDWVINYLSHLVGGLPWQFKGHYEARQVELYWWAAEHPGLGVLIVFLAVAFLTLGIRRLLLKGATATLIPLLLLLPAIVSFAETRARGGYIYVWYLLFLLPGIVVLISIGLDEIPTWARSRAGKIAGWGFVLFMLGGYTAWTAPQRGALMSRSLQPNRESVLVTRPSLDPNDPRQKAIITATFYGAPEPYDPNIVMFRNATELGELVHQADAEGKQLFINLGYLTTVEGEHANKYALLKKSGMFETIPVAQGYEPTLQSRHVFRYIPGSAKDFDFSKVPGDRGREGSSYSY